MWLLIIESEGTIKLQITNPFYINNIFSQYVKINDYLKQFVNSCQIAYFF